VTVAPVIGSPATVVEKVEGPLGIILKKEYDTPPKADNSKVPPLQTVNVFADRPTEGIEIHPGSL
jgi:hypothetical protein